MAQTSNLPPQHPGVGPEPDPPATPPGVRPALYQAVWDHASDGIAVYDEAGRYLDVNGRYCTLLGFSREELLGLRIVDILDPEDLRVQPLNLDLLRAGRTIVVERRLRHRDGHYVHTEISARALGDGLFLAIVRDVTERRLRDEELRIRTWELGERVKERTCLDEVSRLLSAPCDDLAQTLQHVVELIPAGWAEPDRTGARLVIDGTEYLSPRFEGEGARLAAAIGADGAHDGLLEVTVPVDLVPQFGTGPFLPEERRLLQSLAERISQALGRRRLEASLRRSEAYFRSLAENASDILTILAPDGRILYSSPSIKQVLGYDPASRAGASVLDYIHPEDRSLMQATLAKAVRDPTATVTAEYRYRHLDGDWRVLESTGSNLMDDPAVGGLVITSRDITARRAAEEKVRFQARLLDAVGEAVMATDMKQRIIYWNRAAEKLYGWPADEVLGRAVLDVTPMDPSAEQGREILERLGAGLAWSGEFEVKRRDGTSFTALVTDAPIHDDAGNPIGVIGVSQDISAQKALELKLLQAQKMEAVGRLAGGVAHDFNNLITGIQGFAQLLAAELPGPSPLREDLSEIERSAGRAASLTRQLLAFSRQQVLQPRVLDLRHTVAELTRMLRRLIGEHIELVTQFADPVGHVRVDPVQIEQVIMNLALNARDAMQRGGRLTMMIDDATISAAEASSYPYRVVPGDYVRLSFTDTGPGIDAEVADRIFDPFFTTKGQGDGTGLGLSTVYGIVKQSDGYIWLQREPGSGARFDVYLPRVEARPERPLAQRPPRHSGGNETVLVVEDDATVRSLVRRVLTKSGYHVIEAANGAEGLGVVEGGGQPDLVLTDVVMPRMGGQELAERLRHLRPGLPVVLMSGYIDSEVVREGVDRAHLRFLEKPFTPESLALKVREALNEA